MLSSELSATEKEEILNDVTSRLWFTYRRNFPPIDWRWNKQEPRGEYLGILTAFLDKKDSYYSIHQIGDIKSEYSIMALCVPLMRAWCYSSNGSRRREVHRTVVRAKHSGTGVKLVLHRVAPVLLFWDPSAALVAPPLECPIGEALSFGTPVRACQQQDSLPSMGLIDSSGSQWHRPELVCSFPSWELQGSWDELIYLDPHTTQLSVEPSDSGDIIDDSFHCQHPPCRMHMSEIDPSIAVGFFCNSEEDFDDWCQRIRKLYLTNGALPMFEVVDQLPIHLSNPDVLNLTPGKTV
ncbi:hypothetical protein AB205_0195260 [Aquarana catesbeiana]|uniref:Cysteine protease n=1 Tax=Aquarana catesbeiana TaxID=8400 RepID=A0A2G9P1L9_AQUCT|nr:hypothetical protein AB205_0195260 [Aquarana catesbeiana]